MAKKRSKKSIGTGKVTALPASPVEHQNLAPCSIELNRDAKGQARWSIKAYGELHELDDIRESVLAQDRALKKHEAKREASTD